MIFSFGCINVHASLLPKYRGAAPINWAIIRGERVTESLQWADEGLIQGILYYKRNSIGDKTAGELHNELAEEGAKLGELQLIEEGLPRRNRMRARAAMHRCWIKIQEIIEPTLISII